MSNGIKSVIGEIIVVVILVGILIFSFVLFNKKEEPKKNEEKTVYAIVKGKDNDKVLVENIDDKEKIYILKDMEVKAGDIIVIKYINDINECDYEIIGDSNDYTEKTSEVINTLSRNTTTESTTTTTSTTKVTNKVTSTTSKKVSADDIIQTVKEKSEQAIEYTKDEKNKGKVKEVFIQLVDFIFYGGEIKGHTFSELSESGKAKVIYYTLKLDGVIDEKWPDYKEKISDKTKDIKAKLIAKYMEFTTKVCSKYPEQCAGLKEDWNEVKTRFKFSWDVIKDAFNKYAKPKGLEAIEALKEWYMVFSGKGE